MTLCACGCGQKTQIATKTDRKQGRVKGQPNRFITGHNARIRRTQTPEPAPTFCECGCGGLAPVATKTDRAQGYVKGHRMRFIRGHHARLQPKTRVSVPCGCGCGEMTTPGRRFISGHNGRRGPADYVEEDRGYTTPCWVWQRFVNPDGYGIKRRGERAIGAHRVYYEAKHGPIPAGLELDHLCRVRCCVNPDHLEPVTKRENILRGDGMGARYARRTAAA